MGKTCMVPNCISQYGKKQPGHVALFVFPKNRELQKLWMEALNLPDELENLPKQRKVVCSKHFKEDDYFKCTDERCKLKPKAVPITVRDVKEEPVDLEEQAGSNMLSNSTKELPEGSNENPSDQNMDGEELKEEIVEIKNEPLSESSDSEKPSSSRKLNIESIEIKQEVTDDEKPNEVVKKVKKKQKKKPKDRTFECSQCEYKTKSRCDLIQHRKDIHGSEIEYFLCTFCDYKTNLKASLQSHLKFRHLPEDQVPYFHCADCTYKSVKKYNLREHIKYKHTKIDYNQCFTCEICGYCTYRGDSLKKHLYQKHPKNSKILDEKGQRKFYYCDKCSYKTTNRYYLEKKHYLNKHLSENEVDLLLCDECGYQTKTRYNLQKHWKVKHMTSQYYENGGKEFFNCQLCDYKGTKMGYLMNHLKAQHARPKRPESELYECDQCDYKGTKKVYLKKHKMGVHDKIERSTTYYTCEYCGEQIKGLECFKAHILFKHNQDVEYFQCLQCDYKSKTRSNLKSHVIFKHTSKDELACFVCELCGYKAKRRYLLVRHMNGKHGKDGAIMPEEKEEEAEAAGTSTAQDS